MTLGALLKEAGITVMTYRTLVRNVSFIRRRRRGDDDISHEQLLALKSFALLRAHGLRAGIAAVAVETAFPAISTFVRTGKLPSPAAYKVGVRLLSLRGKLIAAPINGPPPPGSQEVGRVELDLRGVDELLPGERRSAQPVQSNPVQGGSAFISDG